MILIQKCKPNLGFFSISAADRLYAYFTQLIKITTYFRNIQINGDLGRTFKTKRFISLGQIDNAPVIQCGQGFAAAHLFKASIGRMPVLPLANPP
jgi:hypothetical protein